MTPPKKKIPPKTPKIPKIPKKIKSKLPHNISDEDFISAVDTVTKKLGHKFRFGYHSFEDMKQQATIFALESLENYDSSRPLENFLWTHIRNRLFNFKRDNYQRPDKPCFKCEFYDPLLKVSSNQCGKFCDKQECPLYQTWSLRNENKKNIMAPQQMEDYNLTKENHNFVENIENEEIIKIIENNIPLIDRPNYLKLKHGIKIPRAELIQLKKTIINIIEENKKQNDTN